MNTCCTSTMLWDAKWQHVRADEALYVLTYVMICSELLR